MIRRAITFTILLSMMLHCAARLGVLSYLYKNRHDIANTVGLISEVPIALCNSDYDFQKRLHIQHIDHHPAPAVFLTAQEIILFFQPNVAFGLLQNMCPSIINMGVYTASHYSQPTLDFFQPPRIA